MLYSPSVATVHFKVLTLCWVKQNAHIKMMYTLLIRQRSAESREQNKGVAEKRQVSELAQERK